MKEAFKRATTSIICSSIIAFIIGLIMVINPSLSLKTIGFIVGIYVIIHGILLVVLDFKANEKYNPFEGLVPGILSIILGIMLIAMPKLLSTILALALGIWIILSSVNTIKLAITIKKENSNWNLILLLGIIDLIVGIIMIFNPFASSVSITIIIGILIIVHSVISIVDMIIIMKNTKNITKAIETTIKNNK